MVAAGLECLSVGGLAELADELQRCVHEYSEELVSELARHEYSEELVSELARHEYSEELVSELARREYSEELVSELARRDELDFEKELKNQFIWLLLRVQRRRRQLQQLEARAAVTGLHKTPATNTEVHGVGSRSAA